MSNYLRAIDKQYGQVDLCTRILAALTNAGIDIENLSLDDLALFDEFHIGGRDQTRKLANLTGVHKDMQVLDIGSGVGGPARTLAAEFGCAVTGIDLSEEFCLAAKMLSERVGLSKKNRFYHGSALDLPFDKDSFDVVWTQHASMNIADKRGLYQQIRQVLRPKGRLALQDIMSGSALDIYYPVFWANEPSISFLAAPEEIRQLLAEEGFREIFWSDLTEQALQLAYQRKSAVQKGDVPLLDVNVIVAEDVPQKAANMLKNMEEGRMVVIQAVFERID